MSEESNDAQEEDLGRGFGWIGFAVFFLVAYFLGPGLFWWIDPNQDAPLAVVVVMGVVFTPLEWLYEESENVNAFYDALQRTVRRIR